MRINFADIEVGELFRFLKIKGDYTLKKTSNTSWETNHSNCKTYRCYQSVTVDEPKSIHRLNTLAVEKCENKS